MGYLLRRTGLYLVAAWAALSINFALSRMMPGDAATAMFARMRGQLSTEAMAALRATFGRDDSSLFAAYADYVGNALSGDFGVSVAYYPAPVSEVIGTGLVWTLLLVGCSVVISFALGTFLGALAAHRRGGWLDSIAPPVLAFVAAFPYFWLAMLALYLFGFSLGWFPLRHAYGDAIEPGFTIEFVASVVRHAILPAATIVIATVGGWMLNMRNTTIGVLGEDYATLARAKGLSPRRVMLRYTARNALLPNITGFGMALGFVVSGALLTEIVFSYPGLGYLLVQAVRNQDYPLMQGLFFTITMAVLVANLIVDLLYVWLDPRTRGGRAW